MCWICDNNSDYINAKIAAEDIVVYKLVYTRLRRFWYKKTSELLINSLYKNYSYYLGKLTDKIDIKSASANHNIIYEGYHSYDKNVNIVYNTKDKYKLYVVINPENNGFLDSEDPSDFQGDLSLLKCIIPTGTKYYINEDGEIVSEQIKPIDVAKLKIKSFKLITLEEAFNYYK